MKKVIASLCLVGLGLAGRLNIGLGARTTAGSLNAYDLSCDGANGKVKFYVTGLPQGVTFDGSTIVITNSASAGSYTINIKAIDEFGQSAERNVSLSIQTQTVNQYSGQYNNGNDFNNAFNGDFNLAVDGFNTNNGASVTVNQGSVTVTGSQGNVVATGGPAGSNLSPAGGAPGGNGPTGGAPGGNAPSGGSPSDAQLLNLLNNYSSPTPGSSSPNYPDNRYPEPNFPTAPTPNLLNPTPLLISTGQSQPTDANRNPVTPDDVKLRAASDRHQNAIKGITNLLKIIDQANANKNKAQSDIQTYTQAYNDAVSAQRNSQNEIIAA